MQRCWRRPFPSSAPRPRAEYASRPGGPNLAMRCGGGGVRLRALRRLLPWPRPSPEAPIPVAAPLSCREPSAPFSLSGRGHTGPWSSLFNSERALPAASGRCRDRAIPQPPSSRSAASREQAAGGSALRRPGEAAGPSAVASRSPCPLGLRADDRDWPPVLERSSSSSSLRFLFLAALSQKNFAAFTPSTASQAREVNRTARQALRKPAYCFGSKQKPFGLPSLRVLSSTCRSEDEAQHRFRRHRHDGGNPVLGDGVVSSSSLPAAMHRGRLPQNSPQAWCCAAIPPNARVSRPLRASWQALSSDSSGLAATEGALCRVRHIP